LHKRITYGIVTPAMNTISCGKCGNIIEVSQAMEEQLRHTIEAKVKADSKKEMERLLSEAEAKISEKMASKFQTENKLRSEEIDENRRQNLELRGQIEELLKQQRQLRTEKDNLSIDMQRKLLDAQDKLIAEAKNKASEEYKLVIAELTKQISDSKKLNEELKGKLDQKSQQLIGEVRELDLETTLRASSAFRDDEFQPIGKGVLGADIRQVVRSPRGMECGKILWESKRTRAWSDGWITKLKDDLIADKSHIPVIITEALPPEAHEGIGCKNGVWIAAPKYAVILATLLRKSLLDAAKQKVISASKQTKAEEIYGYITSLEFIHQIENMIETYRDIQKQIADERIVYERMWKKREMQVMRLLSGVSGMYGSMQGIAGASLPVVKGLELSDGDSVDGELQKLL
jgi:hypothetical protein